QEEGAEILLTGFGRGLSLTRRVAKRLPQTPDVLELDVADPEHPGAVAEEVTRRFGRLDGLVHSIGFAPEACLGKGMFEASWDDVSTAIEISTYSLKVLAQA